MRARLLALLEHRDRNVPEPLAHVGVLLEQLPEPDRARKAPWAAAHDQDPHVDALLGRVRRRADHLGGGKGRRVVGGTDALQERPYLRARRSSVSFGAICVRSPTTPRSAKSKIGAFGSLLTATIVPAPCIPTLCWIAPEMPSAM